MFFEFSPDDVLKIALAVVAGGLIGLEREFRDKAAGFRTLIFICVGAALFTMLSSRLALDKDPTRIAANIVTGIGFLGAGAILRDGMRVTGLTTAAVIWLVAAVGMAIGAGNFTLAALVTLTALVVLWLFPYVEIMVDRLSEEHLYEVVFPISLAKVEQIETQMRQLGLHVRASGHTKEGDLMRCRWRTHGKPGRHHDFIKWLLADQEIVEFKY
jgi:putative Mg2+ transporter-C (MgtC) family protein